MLQQQQNLLGCARLARGGQPLQLRIYFRTSFFGSSVRSTPRCSFAAVDTLAVAENIQDGGMYEVGQLMNMLVQQRLADVNPTTCGVVLLAGLLTSLSPCTLSVLPLTIGYIAGYAEPQQQAQQQQQQQGQQQQQHIAPQSQKTRPQNPQDGCDNYADEGSPAQLSQPMHLPTGHQAAAGSSVDTTTSSELSADGPKSKAAVGGVPSLTAQALCFSLGLASMLAALGVVSSSLGRAYGQIGSGLPIAVALVAILMGLNLLEVVQLPLPSLLANVDVGSSRLFPPLKSYAAGALFALAASPCSTPVLASILAYASTQDNPAAGGLLLFCYSCGYVVPLLVAATATGAAKQLLDMRRYAAWVTPASGVLLVSGGTYALLSRILPSL